MVGTQNAMILPDKYKLPERHDPCWCLLVLPLTLGYPCLYLTRVSLYIMMKSSSLLLFPSMHTHLVSQNIRLSNHSVSCLEGIYNCVVLYHPLQDPLMRQNYRFVINS